MKPREYSKGYAAFALVVWGLLGVLFLALTVDAGPTDDELCREDYRKHYALRGTPDDIGVKRYCENWRKEWP